MEIREVLPDPVYNSTLVEKFICSMMWDGKKSVAQGIFYDSMEKVRERAGDPVDLEADVRLIAPDEGTRVGKLRLCLLGDPVQQGVLCEEAFKTSEKPAGARAIEQVAPLGAAQLGQELRVAQGRQEAIPS